MAFFVDYFDNELNENEVKLLFDFLDDNPDLKDEFDEFENFTLEEQETNFENKASLKRHIDKNNIEDYIIAGLEGILDISDKKEYTDFIAENGLYTTTIERYKRTILPQENIVYPNKKSLKQKSKLVVLWPTLSAIAAALILFIVLNQQPESNYQFQALKHIKFDSIANDFNFIQETIVPIEKEIAKNESIPSTKVKNSTKKVNLNKKENKPKETIVHEKKKVDLPIINETIDNNNSLLADNNLKSEKEPIEVKSDIENIPTVKQAIHNSIKSRIFNDEDKNNQLIDKEYLIAATTEKVNNSKNVTFKQTSQNSRKKTRLKIGKFEFYRDKKA